MGCALRSPDPSWLNNTVKLKRHYVERPLSTKPSSQRGRWGVLAVLAFSLLAVAVDATVLNVAIPTLARELRPSSTQMLWIVNIYSLLVGALLLTAGPLGDRLGRKRFLLGGFALFGASSVFAALSDSAEMLLVARALLGVGAAVIMPSTLSILRNVFTDRKERTFALGVWSSVAGAGAAVGPLLAGFLLERFSWGSVFLINVPLMGLALVLGAWLIPESRDPDPSRWDATGAVLSLTGLLAFVYGLQRVAADGFTLSGIGVGIGGVVLLGALVVWLRRVDEPLIDLGLFRDRAFAAATGALLVAMFAMIGLMFLITQQLQVVMGYSPLQAGLRLMPLILGAVVGAPLVGLIVPRFGTRTALSIGLLVLAGALLILAWVGPGSGLLVAVIFPLIGAGAGAAMTAASDAIMSGASADRAGGAAGIEETSYQVGAGLGVAVMGSIATAVYAARLTAIPGVPGELMDSARDSVGVAAAVADQLPGELGRRLRDATESAFAESFTVTALLAGLALAAAAVMTFFLVPRKAGLHDEADPAIGPPPHLPAAEPAHAPEAPGDR